MNIVQAIILGVVQGATEFIPVSSSAHLVLVPALFGWSDPGLLFDVVLHLGTLLAVLAIFWRDLWSLAVAWLRSAPQRRFDTAEARLAWWIILGSFPAAILYLLWGEQFEALFHSPVQVSALLLATGLWLTLAERLGRKQRQAEEMSWWQPLLIGLAQGCAIAPGISRSGATIGAGLLLGLKRDVAARFSFLLATPIVFGAGLVELVKLLGAPSLGADPLVLIAGSAAAFLSGCACIRFLLGYLKQHSLYVFAIYCWLAGLGCIIVLL